MPSLAFEVPLGEERTKDAQDLRDKNLRFFGRIVATIVARH
jgi:hypothetical protein